MNFIKSLKLIFIFLFVLTVSKTKAQDILKPKFGLRAGASFSTMFGPSEDGVDEQHKLTVRIAAGGVC